MRIVVAVLMLLATFDALALDQAITFLCCAFTPTTVTIAAGDSVSWAGQFSMHPLQQVDGASSDTPVPGGFANSSGTFYSVQFSTPGTYYFRCAFHGVAQFGGSMRGSIVVNAPVDLIFGNGFE